MFLLLIAQTLLVPLALSILIFSLKRYQRLFNSVGIAFVWLISYFWIMGFTTLLPTEALDWLWLSTIVVVLVGLTIKQPITKLILLIAVFIISFGIYSWPIMHYSLETLLLLKFIFIVSTASIILYFNTKSTYSFNNTLIIICISALGLAFVVALNGSLLIAQLAIILAATLSGFIIKMIFNNSFDDSLNSIQLSVVLNIYLSLLLIAMLYTELSLTASIPLALSSLTIILPNKTFSWLISLLLCFGAFIWILSTTNTQNYY